MRTLQQSIESMNLSPEMRGYWNDHFEGRTTAEELFNSIVGYLQRRLS